MLDSLFVMKIHEYSITQICCCLSAEKTEKAEFLIRNCQLSTNSSKLFIYKFIELIRILFGQQLSTIKENYSLDLFSKKGSQIKRINQIN